jgi:hypothetical protein
VNKSIHDNNLFLDHQWLTECFSQGSYRGLIHDSYQANVANGKCFSFYKKRYLCGYSFRFAYIPEIAVGVALCWYPNLQSALPQSENLESPLGAISRKPYLLNHQ